MERESFARVYFNNKLYCAAADVAARRSMLAWSGIVFPLDK